MMTKMIQVIPVGIVATFTAWGGGFAADSKRNLKLAFERSCGNRYELEIAMKKVKGKDTEYLITFASRYDLVNLTAEQIVENVTYARKVHEALPYLGKKLDDELWRVTISGTTKNIDFQLGTWNWVEF